MKRVILNADDFGLTPGVNQAVMELHEAGCLTSATLMANAMATDEAIALARATPTLGVGCHVVLVDGWPVSAAGSLPQLVSGDEFAVTLRSFLQKLAIGGRRMEAEMEAEAYAQIMRLKAGGVALTHVDTHKHTHMFPPVLRAVVRAAKRAGIGRIRNPFEPAWAVAATPGAPRLRRTQVRLLQVLAGSFQRTLRELGMTSTQGSVGVLATGTLDGASLGALLRAMPEGDWEMVTHPGYFDEDLALMRTRLLASRDVERFALKSVMWGDLERIHYGGL